MAKLPEPGGDNGVWGVILNDFLRQVHTEGGLLQADVVDTAQIADAAITNAKISPTADIAQSKISGLSTALAGKADTSHAHAAADISSGVFNAARLPGATEIAVGAVELATTSEAIAGSDAVRAVTPAGLTAALNARILINATSGQEAAAPEGTIFLYTEE